MSDDEEGKQEKLPTDEELPTSADGDEMNKEEQQDDYIVEVPGGIIYYQRGPNAWRMSCNCSWNTTHILPILHIHIIHVLRQRMPQLTT
ncbi:MAG: hypothetical protein WAL97_02995 [Halobacteriota archaeon]